MTTNKDNNRLPVIGVALTSIDVFNTQTKDSSEKKLRDYIAQLQAAGTIAPGSLVRGRIMNPHESQAVAVEFAAARVDLIILANVAFPNGHVFMSFVTNPHLAAIPLVVTAEPEPEGNEWATNAWCGAIMNNHVATQMGRRILTIPGPWEGSEFKTEFERLIRVAGTIKALRHDFLGRFGDAPGGFHSATGDQMAFAAVFGTRVDMVDLMSVGETYRTGKARGWAGESSFTDMDVQATIQSVSCGRKVAVNADLLTRGIRFYHTLRALIRANGYTSCAVRCWPEINQPPLALNACVAMGLLMSNGDVTAAACESDWPMAVAQTMGTLLSGQPAACLDWINHLAASDIVQFGHCGVGMCGHMEPKGREKECINENPVLRQAGKLLGPVFTGQFKYGAKTGICLTQGRDGRIRLLACAGESSPETDMGYRYSGTDIRISKSRELDRLILEHGFPHHLAMAFGDIRADLRMLCRFLGVEYMEP